MHLLALVLGPGGRTQVLVLSTQRVAGRKVKLREETVENLICEIWQVPCGHPLTWQQLHLRSQAGGGVCLHRTTALNDLIDMRVEPYGPPRPLRPLRATCPPSPQAPTGPSKRQVKGPSRPPQATRPQAPGSRPRQAPGPARPQARWPHRGVNCGQGRVGGCGPSLGSLNHTRGLRLQQGV